MQGDKLIIEENHIKAASRITELVITQIKKNRHRFVITIAGESGSGKSEIASVLSDSLSANGINNIIIQQDDYFFYPPKTNANMRMKDINHVGLNEVQLALLDQNLKDFIEGKDEIVKPLVLFDTDQIIEETVKLVGINVVIVEGTYTSMLSNASCRVFIDRTYIDTREKRRRRAREKQDAFLEEILEIEHRIISSQKTRVDIIITSDFDVRSNDSAKNN